MGYRHKQPDPAIETARFEARVEVLPRLTHENWEYFAACKAEPPETFFPSDATGVEAAKKICELCVVKEECLNFALETRQDHGVWGGMSERQRRLILKRRRG